MRTDDEQSWWCPVTMASFARWVMRSVGNPSKASGRELQEALDVARALALTEEYRLTPGGAAPSRPPASAGLGSTEQKDALNKNLTEQVVLLMQSVDEASDERSSLMREAVAKARPDPDMFPVNLAPLDTPSTPPKPAAVNLREVQGDVVKQRLGYVPRIRPSSITGAGSGSFLDGSVGIGAVVG